MMNPHISVVSLWAEDVPACAHFYRDVLGLPLISHHAQRPHFDLGGSSTLVILKGKPTPASEADPARFPVIALAVNDLKGAVEQLKEHEVGLPWGVEKGPEGEWVMFYDPGGNLIELVEFDVE
jgi:catechol 2,3-dioxygenase-like lactoylglutathione lyase family enzyme